MKRKAIILLMMIMVVMLVNMKFQMTTTNAASGGSEIPDEAIRLRILANSDSEHDQKVKRQVRDAVNEQVATWVGDLTSIKQARHDIRDHLPQIKKKVAQELDNLGVKQSFNVKFGDVKFPTKIYGNYVYPAGTYEALLITLGKGNGANWWCVLFPPLCFLDFENGDAVKTDDSADQAAPKEDNEDVEVKFFIVDWFESLVDKIKGLF